MTRVDTEQARRLRAALRAAGFGRARVGVRVERRRYRVPDGRRFTEWGDAMASFRTTADRLAAVEAAELIAAQGVRVIRIVHGDYRDVIVTSESNPSGRVEVIETGASQEAK